MGREGGRMEGVRGKKMLIKCMNTNGDEEAEGRKRETDKIMKKRELRDKK